MSVSPDQRLRPAALRLAASLLAVLPAVLAAPANAQSDPVSAVVGAYRSTSPITVDAGLTQQAAVSIQEQVVEALRPELGGRFGYKAGLTSPAARERFNVDEPILGTLLTGMILADGSTVSVSSGVSLLIEADLLVRVRDARINAARSRAEALAAIDRLAPFVEIPDVVIAPGQPVNGAVLTAVNSGARWGVMGRPMTLERITESDLGEFTVRLQRGGDTVAQGTGRTLMDHPLEVVLWMAAEARERGITLQAGDWLSLGSLTPPAPVRAGEQYTATYRGLGDEALTVRVSFIP